MERRLNERGLGPKPGAFAAVTVALAALSPALYYLADQQGLSYFVAGALVPASAVVGILRASRRTRAGDRSGSGGRLSAALGWSAVPAGLVFDLTLLPLGLDASSLLMRAVVYGVLVMAGCLMIISGASQRGTKVALGLAALAFGFFTAVALETAGPVVVTGPLLLLSGLLHRASGTGAGEGSVLLLQQTPRVTYEPGDRVQYTTAPVFDLIITTGEVGIVTRVEDEWVFAEWPRSGEHSVALAHVRPYREWVPLVAEGRAATAGITLG